MARRRLTIGEQADGLKKCLASERTPSWLKPSIRKYLRRLERQLSAAKRART
jgi:hypothetical protein